MEQYIIELIQQSARVILPNLGSFMIDHEAEGGVKIELNSILNFDDGVVATHVAKKMGIAYMEAQSLVQQYVNNIKEIIETTGSYKMQSVGTLTKDDVTGHYILSQSTDKPTIQNTVDSLDETELALTQPEEEKEEEIPTTPEPIPSPTPQEAENKADDLLQIDTTATITQVEENPPTVIPTELSSELLNDPLIELQKEEKKPEVKEVPKVKKKEEQKVKTNNTKKTMTSNSSNNKKGWIWIIIAIVIALLAFAVYYFYNKNSNSNQPVIEHTDPEPIIEQPVAEPIEEKPDVIKPIEAAKAFHIIVGSFKTTEMAENLIKKLNAKGYNNATYFTRGEWYVVSIESLPTMLEAERVQEEILDKDRIESWIVNHQ